MNMQYYHINSIDIFIIIILITHNKLILLNYYINKNIINIKIIKIKLDRN